MDIYLLLVFCVVVVKNISSKISFLLFMSGLVFVVFILVEVIIFYDIIIFFIVRDVILGIGEVVRLMNF